MHAYIHIHIHQLEEAEKLVYTEKAQQLKAAFNEQHPE
jgi:hypothetical protein